MFRDAARGVLLTSCVIVSLIISTGVRADDAPAPGESRTVEQGRVEYIAGNAPVIFTAPHGGRIKPAGVASRTGGVLLMDTNTDLLAIEAARAFHERTGKHAHVVICRLHRIKVDCNRPLDDATEGDPQAIATWNAFHGYIEHARQQVTKHHGRGVLLDLHGHAHPIPRVEIGYALRNSELQLPDDELEKLADKSSVHELADHSPQSFIELLRGPQSLGGLLHERGVDCVPSTQNPHAGDAKYFNGGYITRRYGSSQSGTISAMQLECPGPNVRRTEADRKKFAEALADTLVIYMKTHAGIDLTEK